MQDFSCFVPVNAIKWYKCHSLNCAEFPRACYKPTRSIGFPWYETKQHRLCLRNHILSDVISCCVAPCRSGKQQDVLRWSGMPKAADGGHEVPSSAGKTSHVSEPENQTEKVHRGCTLCCRGDGCYQRYACPDAAVIWNMQQSCWSCSNTRCVPWFQAPPP